MSEFNIGAALVEELETQRNAAMTMAAQLKAVNQGLSLALQNTEEALQGSQARIVELEKQVRQFEKSLNKNVRIKKGT